MIDNFPRFILVKFFSIRVKKILLFGEIHDMVRY